MFAKLCKKKCLSLKLLLTQGPLVWKDKDRGAYFLIGVFSWHIECGNKLYPGAYAKVDKVLPWINVVKTRYPDAG